MKLGSIIRRILPTCQEQPFKEGTRHKAAGLHLSPAGVLDSCKNVRNSQREALHNSRHGVRCEISAGLNQTNLLAVRMKGEKIELYVNNQLIDFVNDTTLTHH